MKLKQRKETLPMPKLVFMWFLAQSQQLRAELQYLFQKDISLGNTGFTTIIRNLSQYLNMLIIKKKITFYFIFSFLSALHLATTGPCHAYAFVIKEDAVVHDQGTS